MGKIKDWIKKDAERSKKAREDLKEEMKNLKAKTFEERLEEVAFEADRVIKIKTTTLISRKQYIAVDTNNKKLACLTYVNFDKIFTVLDFDKILSFELQEDGNTVLEGSAGKALAGALLFGIGGAIVGSSGKSKMKTVCKNMILHLRVNDLDNPLLSFELLGVETKKGGIIYNDSKKLAEEILSILENSTSDDNSNATSNLLDSHIGQLREYKNLLDEGILTQEEFDSKKRELLKL